MGAVPGKRKARAARGEQPSSHGDQEPPGPVIVGIGASAGGLGALRSLFSLVPSDSGVAFVVVVHLSPEHESHLPELLQPYCEMPVAQVRETVAIRPNHVYVIPPNANLSAIDTHLRLSELEAKRYARAPIDHFLRTLAETQGRRGVGVVLTGTGSDGTLGMRRIKEHGGLTIVQNPEEAEHDGMPRSAIATGMIDFVLPLREIPDRIIRFARTNPHIRIPSDEEELARDSDRLLQKIFVNVRARTGHDFSKYKRSTILRRIARRMQLHQVETLADYLELLHARREEAVELFNDLLITVTEFFRDRGVFEALEQRVIPALFASKGPRDKVRIWSVGCSTGEEAYSIAMLLVEECSKRDARPRLQVFASDLHERSLLRAREGVFPLEIAAEVSQARLDRFFEREDGSYRVRRDIREMVVFAPHDVLTDPPFSHLDLLVCRNLMIYLQRDVQQDIATLFHYALNPSGWLVLGNSETLDRHDLFALEDKEHCIYRRRDVPTREPRMPLLPIGGRFERVAGSSHEHAPRSSSYGSLHERMLEFYAPPSLLVNQSHEVVHSSTSAGEYLRVPGGEPTSNIFKLVLEPLRIELRAAIHSAAESPAPVRSKPVAITIAGEERSVVIRVQRASAPELSGFFLIIFDREDSGPQGRPLLRAPASASAEELETELAVARQRLQMLIEEYESSREEMQASNEELQSTNEELRSTLEELETSKEELQSMNEELITLNQENRHRVEELSQLSDDLHNLMAASQIPTLFLDQHLRIVRFTPHVTELFNIRASDKGRPLADFTHRLGYPELQHDARRVLDRLVHVEREVRSEAGRRFLTRILPYRASDNRIDGVVITLIDITERREAEEAQRTSEKRWREIISQVKDYAIFSTDLRGRAVTWNEGVQRVLGFEEAEFIGQDINNTIFTPEDIAAGVPQKELETAAAKGSANNDRWMRRKSGERFYAEGITSAIRDESGRLAGYTKVLRDQTDLRLAEEHLREGEERLRLAAEATGFGSYDLDLVSGEAVWSDRLKQIMGVEGAGPFRPDQVLAGVVHPDDLGRVLGGIAQRADGAHPDPSVIEFRIRRGNEIRWVRDTGHALADGAADKTRRTRVVGTVLDITEEKRREEHMRLVMAELNHRVKNTLAVVVATAEQTFRAVSDPREFMTAFSARLRALSDAHALLTRSEWQGAGIEDVLRAELERGARRREQVRLRGPDVFLKPDAAMAFHMAVHELATNAAKHGSLSTGEGTVAVTWRLTGEAPNASLEIEWVERGGPPCDTQRSKGFGSKLLETTITYQLAGSFSQEFHESGLRSVISIPWSAQVAAHAPELRASEAAGEHSSTVLNPRS